jgi:hypothetical protein
MMYAIDKLVLVPDDIDLGRSPLAGHLDAETYVLGAFNPALTRLPNGNLLMMVRVAEALRQPVFDNHIHAIRWEDGNGGRFVLDAWPLEHVDTADPRKFMLRSGGWKIMALTSLSWLLPVELTPDGTERVAIHYDRAIGPGQPAVLRRRGRADQQSRRTLADDHMFGQPGAPLDDALHFRQWARLDLRGYRARPPEQGHADLRRADRWQLLGADAAAGRSLFRLSARQRMACWPLDQSCSFARCLVLETAC